MAVVDQSHRSRALCADHSFVVQAPAGSGKTELLIQRFLKLLSRVEKPEQVLAITFTRKATQEMRERILHRLGQAAKGQKPEAEHAMIAVDFAAAVLARDREFGWSLRKNPGRLQIHTIDGLCARITGRSPLVGHGVAGLGVIEDAIRLYRKAVQRLIEDMGKPNPLGQVHEALTRVLVHVQGNTRQLLELLSQMLASRDQWLQRIGVQYADMQKVLAAQQEIELACLDAALGADNISLLVSRLSLLAVDAHDPGRVQEFMALQNRARSRPRDTEARVRGVLAALRALATASHAPLSPRSANKRVMAGSGPSRYEHIGVVKDILSEWYGDVRTAAVFKRFVGKPPLEDRPGGRSVLEDFRLLLKVATAELNVFFVEEGKADFQHFAELAMRALGDEDEPGDALLIEDGRVEHILMDEFQDTSHSQFQLLKRLVSGWQPGDGRTLFLVGDPMQSIYRFRQADVKLFTQVFAMQRLGDIPLTPLRLSFNFRSKQEVIGWVNQQFGTIFSAPPGPGTGSVEYVPVTPERGQGGQVSALVWPEALGDEWEARQIATLIGGKLLSDPNADIAVLARKRTQLATVAEALQKAGIAFDAVQVEHLDGRPVVLDLLSFTRAILHPGDRIAWLALLRAPWCGLTPAQLHLVAGEDPAVDLLARIVAPGVVEALPAEQASRVSALHAAMCAVLEAKGRVPLHRLVEVAWLSCKGPYATGSQLELDNAQVFFDLLARVESEQHDDLLAVLQERLGDAYSGSTSAQVQLMTIHKAKGLEFDIVILPGLHKGVGGRDRPLLRVCELQSGDAEGVLMAPVKYQGLEGESLYDYLGQLDTEAEACEAQRILYVAATRAKKELHLSGGWRMTGCGKNRKPGSRKGTFMDMLWPYFEPAIDQEADPKMAERTASEPPLLPQLRLRGEPELPQLDRTFNRENTPIEMRILDRDAVALGKALHLWLELIHDHWARGWKAQWFEDHPEALASSLLRAGVRETSLPELLVRLVALIKNVLESTQGRGVLSPDGKSVSWAELEIFSREGVHLRRHVLDRLYQEPVGSYVIVDYKTGAGDEKSLGHWHKQLANYRSIVEQCTGVPVQATLIYQPEQSLITELEPRKEG